VDDGRSSLIEVASAADKPSPIRASGFWHWLSRLRSYLILDPLVFFYTFLLGSASFLVSFFDRDKSKQHSLARAWSRWILATTMTPVAVTGLESIDTSRVAVYAANHISALDIPVLYAHLPLQFRILAKQELFRYPFVGGHLKRSGQFAVSMDNARASIRSLGRAIESLKAGMPLVVFPEGGRSEDGHISPFKGGAFYAAIKAQVPVIPLAIVGTYEALPMNTYHIQPRPLQLLVGQPISTADYSLREMDALAERAQRAIEEMYYANGHLSDPRGSAAE
jgi:1-acyl-sn-glycerol-3-phosphate acyltransferase